jgi:peptide chain release factor 1
MLKDRLSPFIDRYKEVIELLSTPEIAGDITKMTELSKESSYLEPIVEKATRYLDVIENISENRELLGDPELGDLAKEELKELEIELPELEEEIKFLLVPKDPLDDKNIYLEIRAGTGGDEAAIFAGDLFRAYVRYADLKGWKVEMMSCSDSDHNGYKEVIALIKGDDVYSRLKFESGVHRVQRVPKTETQGRVHTSAITVAVMPEVEDVEIEIKQSDLKIDVFRSGGNGGQSVNTTDSAVRITHLPTGVVVSMQDEKSQHKNKDKAMKILKSRIFEAEQQRKHDEISGQRKELVGSGDRSERIRTYNYPQNRMSDHRITLTLYRLEEIMSGGLFDEIVDPLSADYQAEAIKAAGL